MSCFLLDKNPEKYAREWRKWLERWSKMSFTEFFLSKESCDSKKCPPKFRPWPKIAIDGLTDVDYIPNSEVIKEYTAFHYVN